MFGLILLIILAISNEVDSGTSFLHSAYGKEKQRTIAELASGPPVNLGKSLPSSSYVEVEALALKNPIVMWVNYAWLLEQNIEIPRLPSGSVNQPLLMQQLNEALAYMIPDSRSGTLSAFGSKIKKLWVDFYGGSRMGSNFGSGRAASVGFIQIKGVGKTPLVGEVQNFDHAHGGASGEEGIREAVWGEVFHQVLPYGSNRVIALIATGTHTEWADGGKDLRVLIIREDAIRPAHYLKSSFGVGKWVSGVKERAVNAINFIKSGFSKYSTNSPLGEGQKNDYPIQEESRIILPGVENRTKPLSTLILQYTQRLAEQASTAFAKRFYHGASSPSNIETSAKYLDHGTTTSLPDHGPAIMLNTNGVFGDISDEAGSFLFRPLEEWLDTPEFSRIFGKEVTLSEVKEKFVEWYHENLMGEMLKLTGVPVGFVKQYHNSPVFVEMAEMLVKLALSSCEGGGRVGGP